MSNLTTMRLTELVQRGCHETEGGRARVRQRERKRGEDEWGGQEEEKGGGRNGDRLPR